MALTIRPLASGSGGNAVLLQAGGTRVLVDAGLQRGELLDRLDRVGLRLSDLDALIVSHGHRDHSRSVATLSRRGRIPVYATQACLELLGPRMLHRAEVLPRGGRVEIGELGVVSFVVEHDAADTLGFCFEWEGWRVGYCTDLGSPGGAILERLRGVDGLYLEFNHDRGMLMSGPYPMDLKRRVAGPRGHLSNEQAAGLLGRIAHGGLRFVYLAHLSQVNNRPELAIAAARGVLRGETEVLVALQDAVSAGRSLG